MSIPGIPTSFVLQQGNRQVFLNWALVSGATSYQVQRSTNGVTYSIIDSPTVNNFLDDTVSVQTLYYYKVASTNSDGTSSYTSALQIIPTLTGELSLGELRLRAQQRADRVNSNFVSTAEWNFYINQSYYELYDLLITVYEDYYVAPKLTFQTDGTSSRYDLPNGANYDTAPALYKLYGVDFGLNGANPDAFYTLKKFNFIQRNRYVFPQVTSSLLGVYNPQYRLIGNTIMFIPLPSGGQTVGLWYFPRLTTLLQDTDVMDGISGWTQYPIIRAAKYALDKEESDTSKLDAEILFLKQRIEETATNRDAGSPDTISDARTSSELYGYNGGNGWGFPNGGT